MKKTLFVNCCPRRESRTLKMAEGLLRTLGDYEELRLYDEELPPLDEERLARRSRLIEEGAFDDDSFALARQFAAAERIVIAAPFWDLSFPAKLKAYIENIYVTGIVSRYNEQGMPEGLCKAAELYYVTTAGGPYDGRFSFDYLREMAQRCFGIPQVHLLKAEMLDIEGNDAAAIVTQAMAEYGLM